MSCDRWDWAVCGAAFVDEFIADIPAHDTVAPFKCIGAGFIGGVEIEIDEFVPHFAVYEQGKVDLAGVFAQKFNVDFIVAGAVMGACVGKEACDNARAA